MHTRVQLAVEHFSVQPADDGADFRDWGPLDRLAVIVDRPLGGLHASLAIQLAIARFYDLDGGRRRERAIYPDNYLIHVGRPWGDFSAFDFWPDRREIFVPADPAIVLDAINDRGITHLLLPAGVRREACLAPTEVEAAKDRIKLCLLYDAAGTEERGELTIETAAPAALENLRAALDMSQLIEADPGLPADGDSSHRYERWRATVRRRLTELSPEEKAPAAARIGAAMARSRLRETYWRCPVGDALARLCGDAPGLDIG